MRQQIFCLKRDYSRYMWIIGVVLTGLSFGALAVSAEFSALSNALKDQNGRGYGKTISTEITKLTILNKTGWNGGSRTFKIRTLNKQGAWSNDTQLPPGSSLTYSMAETRQVSLNGDGSSDDVKIYDTKGYIEYISGQQDAKTLWANMMTWNGDNKQWLLTSLFNIVDGDQTALLPSINKDRKELTITLLDGYNYGATLSNTYKWIRILNSTSSYSFPIRYQKDGDWNDDKVIGPGQQSSWHLTAKTERFSLNGKGNNDDLMINDGLGYIEFNLGKAIGHLAGVTMKSNMFWVTQAWYHPVIKQWFGLGSWSKINNQGEGLSDDPSVTLTPRFDFPSPGDITLEIQAKP